MLRPPPPQRNQGLISGQITDLIDIDYETLVLLLGVAGAGASWVLYQAILTKGRRAFRSSKQGVQVLFMCIPSVQNYWEKHHHWNFVDLK